jgi:hypothetical protein
MFRSLTAPTIAIALALLPSLAVAQTPSPPAKEPSPPAKEPSPPAKEREAKEANLRAYVELLRSDLRTQKVAIITEMMEFTEAEDAAFWPIYREYELEMSKLGDERIALIDKYAKAYSQMSDATADELAIKALDLEARRQAVKRKYYERFKQALSARTAARFLQVEQQLLLLIDLQISAALPIIK